MRQYRIDAAITSFRLAQKHIKLAAKLQAEFLSDIAAMTEEERYAMSERMPEEWRRLSRRKGAV